MPNYERGVYEPGDDVRVFDGSEEEDDVEGSRLPLLIVLALLVLAMFAGVVWLAYTRAWRGAAAKRRCMTAAAGPARVAPQNPGGAAAALQGLQDLRAAGAAGRGYGADARRAGRGAQRRRQTHMPLGAGAAP